MEKITGAEFVINALGGITSTARSITKSPSTVQGWKDRGRIPQDHWDDLIAVAAGRGLAVEYADFVKSHPKPVEAA